MRLPAKAPLPVRHSAEKTELIFVSIYDIAKTYLLIY